MIAVAVSIATCGAGVSACLIGALGQFGGVIATAAFETIAQQAALSFINNKGNLGKVFKELGSKENVRGLATAMGVAAVSFGVAQQLNISTDSIKLSDRFERAAVRTGVGTAFNVATQDLDLKKAALQGGVNIAANVLGAFAANQIAYLNIEGLNYFTHKLLHTILGAGVGAASNLDDPLKGAGGGAIGALGAEVIAGMLPESIPQNTRANIATLLAAGGAFAAKQDVNAAGLAARNAMENNFLFTAELLERAKTEEGRQSIQDLVESAELFDDFLAQMGLDPVFGNETDRSEFASAFISERGLDRRNVDPYQVANELDVEDYTKVMGRLERPDAPSSPRMEMRHKKSWHNSRGIYLVRDIANPGQQRFEQRAGMSQSELRQDWENYYRQNGGLTPERQQLAHKLSTNEYKALQDKTTSLGTSAVVGLVFAGLVRNGGIPQRAGLAQPSNINNPAGDLLGIKKPLSQMTNAEFIQELANRAERKLGGTGNVAGIKKHTYAKRLGDRAQKRFGDRGLQFETGYKNGKLIEKGESRKGSTRLDVYDKNEGTVYDYKFVKHPGKGVKSAQERKIIEHGPDEIKRIIEVNPQKKDK